jgi:signal transduction histidine kinase
VNRLRALTFGGAVLAALILGVFAYLIADAQSEDKEDVENRFRDVAQVSAAVTNGIFQASFQGTQTQAAEEFAGPIDQQALVAFAQQGQTKYVAVYDQGGRRLGATPGAPQPGPAVDLARENGQPRLSDVMGTGEEAVVEFAIPYETPSGRRIFVSGTPIGPFADFLAASLGNLPTEFGDEAETAMVDSNGVVLGGANLSSPPGEKLTDPDLLEALKSEQYGDYGDDRYFASSPITNSPFKIVLDTSKSDLYENVTAATISWIIFAAFALALLGSLFFLRRALLAGAELERKQLNERHAVEINDNIIQGLALAKYQLQMGEEGASAAQVSETLREAQRLVSGLLGDAEVQAGQLRREVAAETARPDDPPPEARE